MVGAERVFLLEGIVARTMEESGNTHIESPLPRTFLIWSAVVTHHQFLHLHWLFPLNTQTPALKSSDFL